MIKTFIATEVDGLIIRNLIIELEIIDKGIDIKQAVLDACKEYCQTEEGKAVYDGNCCSFNWGDFDTYVPNKICEKYGFRKLNSVTAEQVSFDEQLVEEADIFQEE